MNNSNFEIAERYAKEMVPIKLIKKIISGCLIGAGILTVVGFATLLFSPVLALFALPVTLVSAIACAVISLICKNSLENKYKEVCEGIMSKKELKKFIKSEEMKEHLKNIFSKDTKSNVEEIIKLSDVLNGRNEKYTSVSIVESIRKEIYGKDAKMQKKNSR